MADEDKDKKPVPPLPPSTFTSRPSGLAGAPRPPGASPSFSTAPSGFASRPASPPSAPAAAPSPARPPLSAQAQAQAPAPTQRPPLFGGGGGPAPAAPAPRPFAPAPSAPSVSVSAGGSNLPTILSGIAILLSVIAIVLMLLGGGGGVSKVDARAIAEDLKKLADKEITVTVPVDTTLSIDRSFDAKDAFPKTLTVPVDSTLNIPEGTSITVLSPSGQPTPFKIVDRAIPIKITMTLDLEKAASGKQITIKKDIPAQVEMTTTIKVSDLYGEEYKAIIEKLEK